MENNNNVKEGCGEAKNNDENPNSTTLVEADENLPQQQPTRTPFTSLSQVDADLALARTLQEQERAYLMLSMNGEMSDYGSSGTGSYVDDDDDEDDDDDDVDGEEEEEEEDGENDDVNSGIDGEEDAFDVHAHAHETDDDDDDEDEDDDQIDEPDPSAFTSDEAYARALQDAEDREMAMRLMALAGINDFGGGDHDSEDHESNSQDTWEEVDPDEMSYEELLALGEAVGTQSRGLSSDTIATLPSISYKAQDNQDGNDDPCVICRLEYEEGETLTVLSCKHSYHSECINNWLQINKVCPVCSTEVSTSESSR